MMLGSLLGSLFSDMIMSAGRCFLPVARNGHSEGSSLSLSFLVIAGLSRVTLKWGVG